MLAPGEKTGHISSYQVHVKCSKAQGALQIPPTSYWLTSQLKDNLPSHKTSQCVYKDSKIQTFNFYIIAFLCSFLYALFRMIPTIALSAKR